MPRQIDLNPQNLNVTHNPNIQLGVTGDQIINTFLSNPLIRDLKAVIQGMIDALNPQDWTNPTFIFSVFTAIFKLIKDFIDLIVQMITMLFNMFNLQTVQLPPFLSQLAIVFDLADLIDAWNTFYTAFTSINWLDWTQIPQDLRIAWMAAWNIAKDLFNWVITVLTNLLGNNAKELFAVFDIADLQAAWDKFFTAMGGIDFLTLDGWFLAAAATVELVFDLINWLVTVIDNITGGLIDLHGLIDAFALPVIGNVIETYLDTLGHINWTLIGTFQPTGALGQFIKATIIFFQGLGNWILLVLNNLLGIAIHVIHDMFSSIEGFITAIIGYAFGDAGAAAWQDALNLLAGFTGAAPWDAVTSIYNQFLDVLKMFGIDLSGGNPSGIGTPTFDVIAAIENFITEMLNPTGLIGAASALAQNIIDGFVNTFLGLGGSGFGISDLIRSIQSIPTQMLTGSILPGQISQLNVGTLASTISQFLVNPTFDTSNSLIGQGIWTWDGTQGPPGLSTSIFADATGVLKELFSNGIATAAGQVLNISGMAQWAGFAGPSNSIALTVAQFNSSNTLIGYDTIASVANPGTSSSGWISLANPSYTVPTSPAGITSIALRPIVDATATAGRVWFGNMSVLPTASTLPNPLIGLLDASKIGSGQFGQNMVANLPTDIANLTSGLNAAALEADLTATWNQIISALGGSGSGLSGVAQALLSIPGANIVGTINSVAVNIQGVIDAILGAGNPSYVDGTGTLPGVTAFLANLPQANVANLVSNLNAKALQTDLTALMSNLGLGTATLAAITNRLANLTATGTMPQSAITNLVANLNTLTNGVNAAALNSDLTALMGNLGLGNANLTAITNRFSNLNSAGSLTGIGAVSGLPGYLTNMNSSGILNSIGAVNGLPGYLNNLNPSGVLSGISSVLGLPGYLTNMSSGGLLNINGVPTSQLTRNNISDLGNVYTTINTTVGSGGIMRRTLTAFVSLPCNPTTGTQIGPQILPASFFDSDEVAPSADLTRTLASGMYRVSLAGWYRCDLCFMVNPQPTAIWNICPVLFRNGAAARYGNDSISWWQSVSGGVTPRFIQSSFEVFLNANDTVQAGYDALGSGTTSTLNNVLTGADGKRCYFSISLENRSLT